MRLRRDEAFLLVVDVQEKLAPHVHGHEQVVSRSAALIRAASLLGLPVVVSEHCPDRIGPTVPALSALAPPALAKTHFACPDEPSIEAALASLRRRQAVVCGMEAHVCVLQTALALLDRGYQPLLVADAVGSRRESDRDVALERLRAAGCSIGTAEMAIFEWMGRADRPGFRELLGIVKALP
ncbi:MAG TPA: hydrolase [Burkholderiales bacterium]|nr:hydrolase [Burkholderiales bacterium]